MFLADQADRGAGPAHRDRKNQLVSMEQLNVNDAARRKRAHELLEQGALKTGADFHDAAFIFQHGEEPEDYLLAHLLAMAAVAQGDPRGRWIAAATLDRYLQAIGQPQVFGTQYASRGFIEFRRQALAARHAEAEKPEVRVSAPDPSARPTPATEVETAQRPAVATAGTPANPDEYVQEPYSSTLISDSLRAQYCVVGIEQQKKNVASLNGGHGLSKRLLPGCKE